MCFFPLHILVIYSSGYPLIGSSRQALVEKKVGEEAESNLKNERMDETKCEITNKSLVLS